MSDDKLPKFLTTKGFKARICDWSDDTIRAKVHNEGLPAVKDKNGKFLFPTDEVLDWFKRRTVRAG